MSFVRRAEQFAAASCWAGSGRVAVCAGLLLAGGTIHAQTAGAAGAGPQSQASRTSGGTAQGSVAGALAAALPQVEQDPAVGLTVPGLNPDENDDGLESLQGLPATQTPVLAPRAECAVGGAVAAGAGGGRAGSSAPADSCVGDGIGAGVQQFLSVPVGSGSEQGTDVDGDPDSAGLTVGPGFGLGRGRRAGAGYGFRSSERAGLRTAARSYSAAGGGVPVGVAAEPEAAVARLHGAVGARVRTSGLNAANSLAIATSYQDGAIARSVVKPHDLRETLAVTLGGAVPRVPRVGFFYGFDLRRRGFPAISSPADPNFYALTQVQRAVLLNRGVTLAQQNAGLNYLSSLTGEVARRSDETVHLLRADWRAGPRVAVRGEYQRVRWSSPSGLVEAPVVARGRASIGSSEGAIDQGLLGVVARWGRGWLEETVVGVGRDLQYERAEAPLAQEPAGGVAGTAPAVEIGPQGLLFGTPPTVGAGAYPDEVSVRLGQTVTYARGKNVLLVGGTAALIDDTAVLLRNQAGTFRYDSGRSATNVGGLVDFLTDYTYGASAVRSGACTSGSGVGVHLACFDSFTQSFGGAGGTFRTGVFAGFVNDTWSPRPGLTAQLGVRYDYTLLPLPQTPNPAIDAVFGARGATSVFPEDRNNVGPRASVAWEPLGAGRGTVRVGYGMFYGRLPGATTLAALTDTARSGATSRIRITPATLATCPEAAGQAFGYACSFPTMPAGAVAQTTSAVVFDRRFRLPAIQQASVTLERGFRWGTVALGYVGNLDRELPTSTDLNILPSVRTATFRLQGGTGAAGLRDGETFQVPVYTTRVTPIFGPVTAVRSSANGTYHALEARAEARVLRSVRLRGAYTWSKTIDYGPNQSATPRTDGQFDPFTNGYDKGLSSLHYPWAAVVAGVWAPEAKGLRGLRVSALVSERAGRPYSYDLFGGTRLLGGHQSLNGSGGALYLPTVGRNTLRLPARGRVDLRVAQGFGVGRTRVTGEVAAFNLLNSQQVTSVVQRAFLVGTAVAGVTPLVFQDAATVAAEGLTGRAFGVANGTGSSGGRERQLELGVRVAF